MRCVISALSKAKLARSSYPNVCSQAPIYSTPQPCPEPVKRDHSKRQPKQFSLVSPRLNVNANAS